MNAVIAPDPDPGLRTLMCLFPLGSRWQFRTYHPAIWPRDWRRTAERAPWGMRAGDLLEVTGYGAARGFPEALLVDRVGDGTAAMLFPSEVTAPSSTRAAAAVMPVAHESAAAQLARAAQDWADDGGRL